jgi:hypothetical protein
VFDGKISVIPNKSWFKKGNKRQIQGGEQPIEVAYLIMSLTVFEEVIPNYVYSHLKELAFSWFMGNNQLGQVVYDARTGGCHDGIESQNLNLNQGAESTICYLLARLNMEKRNYLKREEVSKPKNLYLTGNLSLNHDIDFQTISLA